VPQATCLLQPEDGKPRPAAKKCSPRRKPWVPSRRNAGPEGRKKPLLVLERIVLNLRHGRSTPPLWTAPHWRHDIRVRILGRRRPLPKEPPQEIHHRLQSRSSFPTPFHPTPPRHISTANSHIPWDAPFLAAFARSGIFAHLLKQRIHKLLGIKRQQISRFLAHSDEPHG